MELAGQAVEQIEFIVNVVGMGIRLGNFAFEARELVML